MRKTVLLVLPVVFVLSMLSMAAALPIIGATANTLPAGTFMLDVWGTWQDYSREFETGGDNRGWCGLNEGKTVTSGSLVPRLYYGVSDWFTVRAAVPFEDRYGEEPELSGKSNSGLGDIIVDPKIRLYASEDGNQRIAALAGVRLPTGSTENSNPDLISAVSDGSTDVMIGAVATQHVGDFRAHACVTYWMNGHGSISPDVWVGLGTIEADLDDSWTLLWEYKGVFSSESKDYYRTYACPGIQWRGGRTTVGLSALVSAAATGGRYDFDWAPQFRVYHRFF